MNKLETEFQELVKYLEDKKKKGEHVQSLLKNLDEIDIPKKYFGAFKFYQDLSGDSKTLLFRLAKKPGIKKSYFISRPKASNKISLKAFSRLQVPRRNL